MPTAPLIGAAQYPIILDSVKSRELNKGKRDFFKGTQCVENLVDYHSRQEIQLHTFSSLFEKLFDFDERPGCSD